jgi:hypothetical protein
MCAFPAQPAGAWINTIEEAPVFHPTAAEWADPIAYIRAIQGAAAAAGIFRIVPPLLPAVPGPLVLAQRDPAWRYGVRQQFVACSTWQSFDDAHAQMWESHK